jgi:uroporphyrinogen decarboxylase
MTEKPLLQVLAGQPVWPPPIWLMRQAGRYLPEYRKLRAGVPDFISIRRYGFDAAILFSDILIVPWALGQGLRFVEGEGPVLPPLRDSDALDVLDLARLPIAIAPILETVRRTRTALAHENFSATTLLGFAGSPFTVACYMVEGSGSRDFSATRQMAYAQPDFFTRLISLLTEATITYLSAQIESGAEAIMLFDSWAGILSPTLFHQHVIAPTKKIVTELHRRHEKISIIGFPRLAGLLIGDYVAATGVNAVGMDTSMSPAAAAALIPAHVALQGNLDPMSVVAGGPAMHTEAISLLTAMRGRPFIFNLGHGIVPQTPPEHVADLLSVVRSA